jgi:hypothetical protein
MAFIIGGPLLYDGVGTIRGRCSTEVSQVSCAEAQSAVSIALHLHTKLLPDARCSEALKAFSQTLACWLAARQLRADSPEMIAAIGLILTAQGRKLECLDKLVWGQHLIKPAGVMYRAVYADCEPSQDPHSFPSFSDAVVINPVMVPL